jgi:hypothetical protein
LKLEEQWHIGTRDVGAASSARSIHSQSSHLHHRNHRSGESRSTPHSEGEGSAILLFIQLLPKLKAEGIRRIEAASWCFNDEAQKLFRCMGFGSKTVRFELDLIAPTPRSERF